MQYHVKRLHNTVILVSCNNYFSYIFQGKVAIFYRWCGQMYTLLRRNFFKILNITKSYRNWLIF